jgi:hypothetical protein
MGHEKMELPLEIALRRKSSGKIVLLMVMTLGTTSWLAHIAAAGAPMPYAWLHPLA